MAKGQRVLLPPHEIEKLQHIVKSAAGEMKQRAQAVLLWQEGIAAPEAAKRTKMSENQVRYLWKIYKQKGLDLFLTDPTPERVAETPAPPATDDPDTVSIEALMASHKVELPRAQHVASNAMAIFEATTNLHRLAGSTSALLEAAALLHDIGSVDAKNAAAKGRDVILATAIRGFTEDERRMMAAAVAFQSPKVAPERDPAFKALPDDLRRDALAIAALLRVAVGLDSSRTQTTLIDMIETTSEGVLLSVDGLHAPQDAAAAQKLADVWLRAFATPLRITAIKLAELVVPDRLLPAPTPSLDPQTTVGAAGRAFALRTLERVETLARYVEANDLSVLPAFERETARLREAALLTGALQLREEIEWLHQTALEARLAASLVEQLSSVADDTESLRRAAVEPLAAHRAWLADVLRDLSGKRYKAFAEAFRKDVVATRSSLDNGATLAYKIGELLWVQLSNLRTVMEQGESVTEALRAVRFLQDQVVAFRELLGSETAQVLDLLTPLESYLSNINNAQQIILHLEPKPAKRERKTTTAELDAASLALKQRQVELLNMLADGLPSAWTAVNSPLFRRTFALAIASA